MTMTRSHEFDMGHRVMHELVKCWSDHGHRYEVEITLEFEEMNSIGYALDFKFIKKLFCSYLDKRFDHGKALNPHDTILIEATRKIKNDITGQQSKLHIMNLMGEGNFCNPSAENLSKEIFFAASKLLDDPQNCNIAVSNIRLSETKKCWVDCTKDSLSSEDLKNLEASEYAKDIQAHKTAIGSFEYDARKITKKDFEKAKHGIETSEN